MPVVDVHAHCVPEQLLEALERDAGSSGRFGVTVRRGDDRVEVAVGAGAPVRVRPGLVDLSARLAAMGAAGVDVQLLSPWMDLAATAVDPAGAVDYARLANDAMAAAAATRPDRFLALANLPLHDPAAAAEELRRGVDDLGMVGAEIATRPGGRELDDEAFEVVWRTASELDCLVLVHPYESLRGRGVQRHFLGNLVGNPAESTIAIWHVVFGGVAERHPDLRFCFVHGGGFAPYQVGRWDHAFRRDARGAATHVRTLPSELLRRMWFDTVVHSEGSLRHLLATVGGRQVVLGSDYPFEMGDADPVGSVAAATDGDPARHGLLVEGNARRLLGVHAARLPGADAGSR